MEPHREGRDYGGESEGMRQAAMSQCGFVGHAQLEPDDIDVGNNRPHDAESPDRAWQAWWRQRRSYCCRRDYMRED